MFPARDKVSQEVRLKKNLSSPKQRQTIKIKDSSQNNWEFITKGVDVFLALGLNPDILD